MPANAVPFETDAGTDPRRRRDCRSRAAATADEPWQRRERESAAAGPRDRTRLELRRIEGQALYAARSARVCRRLAGTDRARLDGEAASRDRPAVRVGHLRPDS